MKIDNRPPRCPHVLILAAAIAACLGGCIPEPYVRTLDPRTDPVVGDSQQDGLYHFRDGRMQLATDAQGNPLSTCPNPKERRIVMPYPDRPGFLLCSVQSRRSKPAETDCGDKFARPHPRGPMECVDFCPEGEEPDMADVCRPVVQTEPRPSGNLPTVIPLRN